MCVLYVCMVTALFVYVCGVCPQGGQRWSCSVTFLLIPLRQCFPLSVELGCQPASSGELPAFTCCSSGVTLGVLSWAWLFTWVLSADSDPIVFEADALVH